MHKFSFTEHEWITDRTYLFGLPEAIAVASVLISSWGQNPRQDPVDYADENDARCNLIYMRMQ